MAKEKMVEAGEVEKEKRRIHQCSSVLIAVRAGLVVTRRLRFKGILHQKIFYRLNLIFWIVMGCGIAHFGRRGLKIT